MTETLVASALSLSYLNLSTVLCVGACKHAGKIAKLNKLGLQKMVLGFEKNLFIVMKIGFPVEINFAPSSIFIRV